MSGEIGAPPRPPLRPIERDPDDGVCYILMYRDLDILDDDGEPVTVPWGLVEGEAEVRDTILRLQGEAADNVYFYGCQVVGPQSVPGRWFGF